MHPRCCNPQCTHEPLMIATEIVVLSVLSHFWAMLMCTAPAPPMVHNALCQYLTCRIYIAESYVTRIARHQAHTGI